MKFTKIPVNTFDEIQLNAGILVDSFTPSTGVFGNLVGATSGGLNFVATPEYSDYGEDIDNCPKNTKELKKLDSWTATMSGTFVSVTASAVNMLLGAANIDTIDNTKVIPSNSINTSNFKTLWWIGDYSSNNGNTNGGFIAIKLMNSLSTGGFQIQSGDKAKGTFSFEFTAHYSMDDQETVPFEIYVKSGTPESGSYSMTVTSEAGTDSGDTKITLGASATSGQSYAYQTGYDLRTPNEGSVIGGSAWTSWNGSDEITASSGLDIVVVIKDSENKAVKAGKTIVVSAE